MACIRCYRSIFLLVTVLISIYVNWPKLFYVDMESQLLGISITRTHSTHTTSSKPKSHHSLYEAYTRNFPEEQTTKPIVPNVYNASILQREVAETNTMVLCGIEYGVIMKQSVSCSIADKCEHITKVDIYDMPALISRKNVVIYGDYILGKKLQCFETNEQFQINLPIALENTSEVQIYQLKITNGNVSVATLQFTPVPRSSVFAFDQNCMAHSRQANSWVVYYQCLGVNNLTKSFNLLDLADLIQNGQFQSINIREIHLYRNNIQIYPIENQFFFDRQLPIQITQQTFITAIFELELNSPKYHRVNNVYQTTFRLLPNLKHVSTAILHTTYFPSQQLTQLLNCRLTAAQFHAYRGSTMSHPDVIFQNPTLLCVLTLPEQQIMRVLQIPNLLVNENAIIQSGSFTIRPKEFSMMEGARIVSNTSEIDDYFLRNLREQSDSVKSMYHIRSTTIHQPSNKVYSGSHHDIISRFVTDLTQPKTHYSTMVSHQFLFTFQSPVSKVQIISHDPAYPLISIQLKSHIERLNEDVKYSTKERYILILQTYRPQALRCRVVQIINTPNKITVLKDEDTQDELNIMGYDARILTMEVVDCKSKEGISKPYCSSVILVWNWGIQVYEINWDANRVRPFHLLNEGNHKEEGIDGMKLMPLVNLFACTYLFFKYSLHP